MKNYLPARALLLVMGTALMAQTMAAPLPVTPAGNGSSANPYEITSIENLLWMATEIGSHNDFFDTYFIQVNDIDASGTANWFDGAGFLPIGGATSPGDPNVGPKFKGFYNGQGHVITGLRINRPETDNVGLFGHFGIAQSNQPSVISNLGLVDVVVAGARGTGTLIGRITGNRDTLVERCFAVNGSVTGDGATGGLIGSHNSFDQRPRPQTENPMTRESFADIDVFFSGNETAGKDKFGGLAGCNQKGDIINSFARGNVLTGPNSGTFRVGGLAGCIDRRGEVLNSFSTGKVSGGEEVGGLTGSGGTGGAAGFIENSLWDIESSGMAGNSVEGEGVAEGKTTAEMQLVSTFFNAGWDFKDGEGSSIWNIGNGNGDGPGDGPGVGRNNGYPYLSWQYPADPEIRIWNVAESGQWNTPANWTGSNVPGADDNAVILKGTRAILSGTAAQCIQLTIEPEAALTVESGSSIQQDCQPLLKSGAMLLNKTTTPLNTPIRFERVLSSPDFEQEAGHWTGLGTPVAGSTFAGPGGLLEPVWTQGFPGADDESVAASNTNVIEYRYDGNGIGDMTGGWHPPASGDITPGRGFFVYLFKNKNRDDDNTAVDYKQPIAVTGLMNSFSESTGSFAFPDLVFNGAGDGDSWSLLSNPFGAALDWSAGDSWNKQSLTEFAYIYDPVAKQYLVLSDEEILDPELNGNLVPGEPVIAPFQAFWVKANDESPSLSVDPDALTASTTNSQLFKTAPASASPRAHITLRLEAGGLTSSTGLRFGDAFDTGIDRELRPVFTSRDAFFLNPMALSYAYLYSAPIRKSSGESAVEMTTEQAGYETASDQAGYESASDPAGYEMVPTMLKSLPLEFDGSVTLPLEAGGFLNGLPISGPAAISVPAFANIPDSWSVTLTDHETGMVTDLRANVRYAFEMSPAMEKFAGHGTEENHAGHDTAGKQAGENTAGKFANPGPEDGLMSATIASLNTGSPVMKSGAAGRGMTRTQQPANGESRYRQKGIGTDETHVLDTAATQPRFTLTISQGTEVGDGPSTRIPPDHPQSVELAQNFPNPFNPSTVIGYSLPEESMVRLSVYDLLGRRVAVLVDQRQEPGRHQVSFDGTSIGSGVYFYRLETGGQILTRRMTMIK